MKKNSIKNILLIFCLLYLLSGFAMAQTDTVRLSLQQCREMALQHSQDMERQRNLTEQAELTRKAMLSNFFPQVEGSAMGIYTKDMHILKTEDKSLSLDLLMRGVYMAGFNLTQPIFAGGKLVNGYRMTKVGEAVAEEQERLVHSQVIAEVDNSYWTYVAVNGKVGLLDEYAVQLDTLIDQITAAISVGMATDYDLMRVRTARSNIEYQQRRTRNGADLCRMALCQKIGLNADSVWVNPASDLPTYSTDGFYSDDISARPEVRMMEQQIRAQELQVKMTCADYLPTLGLMAGYSWFGNLKINGNVSMDWSQYAQTVGQIGSALAEMGVEMPQIPNPLQYNYSRTINSASPMVMLSLSVPITKWAEGSFMIKKAKLEMQNAELEVQKNKELLHLEVQKAIRNLDESEGLVQSAEVAREAAAEQLRVTKDRYEVGIVPLSDLLDAQTQWQQAESDYVEARTQQLIYYTEYLSVTGKLQ